MTSQTSVTELIEGIRRLPLQAQREVLARVWPEPTAVGRGASEWRFLPMSEQVQVNSLTPGQEPFVEELRQLVRRGVLARLDSAEDGNYELYGPDRTYYVTLGERREIVGLLDSWTPDRPPRVVVLDET